MCDRLDDEGERGVGGDVRQGQAEHPGADAERRRGRHDFQRMMPDRRRDIQHLVGVMDRVQTPQGSML